MKVYDFKLSDEELHEIQTTRKKSNQLSFALLFKYFQVYKKFPNQDDPMLKKISGYICQQLHIGNNINWESSTIEKNKKHIRRHFGYTKFNDLQKKEFISYLNEFIFPKCYYSEKIEDECVLYFETNKIEPLSTSQQTRFLKSAYVEFEKEFFRKVSHTLNDDIKNKIDLFLRQSAETEENSILLSDLKRNNPYVNIKSIACEIESYQYIKSFELPAALENSFNNAMFKKYHDRTLTQSPSHLLNYSALQRHAILTSFLKHKSHLSLDNLAELLIKLIKSLKTKAEKHVDLYVKKEVRSVNGKFDSLFLLADASLQYPKSIIEQEIYKIVPPAKLKDILEDLKYKGTWFKNQVTAKSLSLYVHGNKKMIWSLFDELVFKTDDARCQRILNAFKWIKDPIRGEKDPIPNLDILDPIWIPFVEIKNANNTITLDRNAYECALLQAFLTELSVKNIWIDGALRYRDPKKDLPQDFKENRNYYISLLNVPSDPVQFIQGLKQELRHHLTQLNDSIIDNKKVKIKNRSKKGSIKITPYAPQEEALGLCLLHKKIVDKWGSLSLMDILKETDLRIGFTKKIRSVLSSERIDENELIIRKLLCVYGIGTNMGIKRMASGQFFDTLSELNYVKLRYINEESIREAIRTVVNEVISIRNPKIWGNSSTGCACDSKKISVWDQNLMSEWHLRYGGRGVMVYWHVDKKSLIIHSQIKTCSSSEVGSMIKGVLDHDTLMEMNEIYTDTHGQSAIGFSLSYLLGFDLLPRIKNINKQKLYKASKNNDYKNIEDAMASTAINWSKIETCYEQIIEYVAALKTNCVEPSVLLKRLSAANRNDPVYLAFLELGKVIRTIFLCKYIDSEDLRIDIHESLNVVERVNGVMKFIFYGQQSELSSNDPRNQELGILCLHLLQVCMVYINTLMIQEIIEQEKLVLTQEDLRALTPLIHSHITPYGYFTLDLNNRIPFKQHSANENSYDTHTRSRKSKTIRQIAA